MYVFFLLDRYKFDSLRIDSMDTRECKKTHSWLEFQLVGLWEVGCTLNFFTVPHINHKCKLNFNHWMKKYLQSFPRNIVD